MHTSANQGIDKQNKPGGGGAYDKVKEDKYYRGTTGAEKEPNKKNKQHRTVKAGTIRE